MAEYINKKAAIKAIEGLHDCYNGFSDTYDKACIVGALEEIAPADVAPVRHGRWEWSKEPHGVFAKCTACGKVDLCGITYDMGGKEYRHAYCPNCGATMDGDKN